MVQLHISPYQSGFFNHLAHVHELQLIRVKLETKQWKWLKCQMQLLTTVITHNYSLTKVRSGITAFSQQTSMQFFVTSNSP